MVGEGDGSAEVCLDLSVPLSTDLLVTVSSSPGTGILYVMSPLSLHLFSTYS